MPDDHLVVRNHGQRQHARHSVPGFVPSGLFKDAIVGGRNRSPDSMAHVTVRLRHFGSNHIHGSLRGLLARRVPAQPVHYQEDAQLIVGVRPILIFGTHAPRIAGRS